MIADPKSHVFLGRAFIDLIPLLYGLRTIVGWYNIMDLAGELHGQIKVLVTNKLCIYICMIIEITIIAVYMYMYMYAISLLTLLIDCCYSQEHNSPENGWKM